MSPRYARWASGAKCAGARRARESRYRVTSDTMVLTGDASGCAMLRRELPPDHDGYAATCTLPGYWTAKCSSREAQVGMLVGKVLIRSSNYSYKYTNEDLPQHSEATHYTK